MPMVLYKSLLFLTKSVAEGKHNASVRHDRKTVIVANCNGFFVLNYGFYA